MLILICPILFIIQGFRDCIPLGSFYNSHPTNRSNTTRMCVKRALIVKEPYCSLITSGQKTWELRTSGTAIRGPVYLMQKWRSPGTATLSDCFWRSLDVLQKAESVARHHVPPEKVATFCAENAAGELGCWVWEFAGAGTFHDLTGGAYVNTCDHYEIRAKRGAQIWVKPFSTSWTSTLDQL